MSEEEDENGEEGNNGKATHLSIDGGNNSDIENEEACVSAGDKDDEGENTNNQEEHRNEHAAQHSETQHDAGKRKEQELFQGAASAASGLTFTHASTEDATMEELLVFASNPKKALLFFDPRKAKESKADGHFGNFSRVATATTITTPAANNAHNQNKQNRKLQFLNPRKAKEGKADGLSGSFTGTDTATAIASAAANSDVTKLHFLNLNLQHQEQLVAGQPFLSPNGSFGIREEEMEEVSEFQPTNDNDDQARAGARAIKSHPKVTMDLAAVAFYCSVLAMHFVEPIIKGIIDLGVCVTGLQVISMEANSV